MAKLVPIPLLQLTNRGHKDFPFLLQITDISRERAISLRSRYSAGHADVRHPSNTRTGKSAHTTADLLL